MRLGLLTTLGTNIGDDFIREGLLFVLRQVRPEAEVAVAVNKHQPETAYPRGHPLRSSIARTYPKSRRQRLKRGLERCVAVLGQSRFDRCTVIVQCGAPIFWPGFERSEWAGPIWEDIFARLGRSRTILNLAGGSCYPWLSQPEDFGGEAAARMASLMLDSCRMTTVRDPLAARLVQSIGREAKLVPCSAGIACLNSAVPRSDEDADLVLLNYMRLGAHYVWNQAVNPEKWRDTICQVATQLSRHHKVAFLAHDHAERELAESLRLGLPVHMPATPREYFALARRAKVALANRLHACVGLAGLGIPSVGVGTDTRMLMVGEWGLPIFYVEEAGAQILLDRIESLLARREDEKERLLNLRDSAIEHYRSIFEDALGRE